MALTGKVSISSSYRVTDTGDTAGTGQDSDSLTATTTWDSGTTTGKADLAFSDSDDSFTGSVTLDLKAIATPLGTINGVEAVEMVFHNTGTVNLEIGPGASNGWAAWIPSTVTVGPDGWRAFCEPADPGLVIDSTHKTFLINCPSGTGAWELHGKMRSA